MVLNTFWATVSLTEYDSPGYLYQGADLNGHLMEYTTLPSTSHINGVIRGGFVSNGSLGNGCPHLHHKAANGVINGGAGLYPGHTGSSARTHDHPHHLMNVSAITQSGPSGFIAARFGCVWGNTRPGHYNQFHEFPYPGGSNWADLCNPNITLLILRLSDDNTNSTDSGKAAPIPPAPPTSVQAPSAGLSHTLLAHMVFLSLPVKEI